MGTRYKRRSYYLKNSAQGKFIVRFVILSLLGGIAALGSFNFLASKKIDAVLYSMHIPNISAGGLLWDEMLYTNLFVIVFTLMAFALTGKGLFSKIHGPLRKMTHDISRMANGDLSVVVSLRQHDEFRDIASELNRMRAGLRERLTRINELTDRVIDTAETLQQNTEDETARATLAETVVELRRATGSFSL